MTGRMRHHDIDYVEIPVDDLYSDDLEATVRAVEAAGGVVSTPPYAFPGGRRFHLTDPAGNELAVWSRA